MRIGHLRASRGTAKCYGIPNFASVVDRWRFLGASLGEEKYYLDVKSVEFAENGRPGRLWLKHLNKKQTYTLVAYEMDCKGRHINKLSTVAYDSGDKMVSSSELSDGWQRIVPDDWTNNCTTGCVRTSVELKTEHAAERYDEIIRRLNNGEVCQLAHCTRLIGEGPMMPRTPSNA